MPHTHPPTNEPVVANEPSSAKPATESPAIAGRCRLTVAVFVVLVVTLLAADLWIKHAAFKNVADTPIRLTRDTSGEPIIWAQTDRPPPMDLIHQGLVVVEQAGTVEGQSKRWWIKRSRVHENSPASAMPPHEPTELIPKVLNLQLTINTGAVFGMGKGFRTGFLIIGVIAIVLITWFFTRSPRHDRVFQFALALILSGALGNLYDRYFFAAVRDMFHMLPSTRLWPWIFNFADIALVVGVCLIILHTFRKDMQAKKTAHQIEFNKAQSKNA